MATLSFVWVGTYAVLGLWLSAAIPFVYQLASAASIYTFARTRRYRLFRTSQLWMSLMLPFVLQWSLGGFATSSAVSLWGVTWPLGALLFVGARQSYPGSSPSPAWWRLGRDRPTLASSPADIPTPSSSRSSCEHPGRIDDGLRAAAVLRAGSRAGAGRTRGRAGQVRAPAAQRPARAGRGGSRRQTRSSPTASPP